MSILCPLDGKECWSSGCFFQHGQNKICTKQNFTIATDRTVMTEPIDQVTKDLIKKEAEEYGYSHESERGYIAGASVWAERLKQERNKAIELEQEVRKYVFWHDKFFNDTIVGQPPSLQPLRDLIKDKSHE